jgi:hypothetical protein
LCKIIIFAEILEVPEIVEFELPKNKDDDAWGELVKISVGNTFLYAHKLLLKVRGFLLPDNRYQSISNNS